MQINYNIPRAYRRLQPDKRGKFSGELGYLSRYPRYFVNTISYIIQRKIPEGLFVRDIKSVSANKCCISRKKMFKCLLLSVYSSDYGRKYDYKLSSFPPQLLFFLFLALGENDLESYMYAISRLFLSTKNRNATRSFPEDVAES